MGRFTLIFLLCLFWQLSAVSHFCILILQQWLKFQTVFKETKLLNPFHFSDWKGSETCQELYMGQFWIAMTLLPEYFYSCCKTGGSFLKVSENWCPCPIFVTQNSKGITAAYFFFKNLHSCSDNVRNISEEMPFCQMFTKLFHQPKPLFLQRICT